MISWHPNITISVPDYNIKRRESRKEKEERRNANDETEISINTGLITATRAANYPLHRTATSLAKKSGARGS